MALLVEGRLLLTDASNVPLNGGKARIYDTGTTDLTSVFSDAGLTTPLTNPVVANSSPRQMLPLRAGLTRRSRSLVPTPAPSPARWPTIPASRSAVRAALC